MKFPLNSSQQVAEDKLHTFITDPAQKYFCLKGPAGFGKTHLLNKLAFDIPAMNRRREVLNMPKAGRMTFTATTHKAASLLGENATTYFSELGIRPNTNYKTNVESYQCHSKMVERHAIVVIDEASLISPKAFKAIDNQLQGNAKCILALDHLQLAPVGFSEPIVNTMGFSDAELTIPQRQDPNSHLYKVCHELRQNIINQVYTPLVQGPGLRFVDGGTFQAEFIAALRAKEDVRMVANTNAQVEAHNRYARKQLHGLTDFAVGDIVIAANNMEGAVRVEASYRIEHLSEVIEGDVLNYRIVGLDTGDTFKIPENKAKYFSICKRTAAEARQSGDWTMHFAIKNNYLDIRDGFACTAFKAQGSTYNKVFVDFADLTRAGDINHFLRMLYVAVSRARHEVVLYGL